MKKLIPLLLALLLAAGCAPTAPAPPAETAALSEAEAGMPNPLQEVTAQELTERTGLCFAVPEGAEDVRWFVLTEEERAIAQMDLTLNGTAIRARAVPAAIPEDGEALEDISGLYESWQMNRRRSVDGKQAEFHFNPGEAGYIAWYDYAPGILYSVSVDRGADQESLSAAADAVYMPLQGEADGDTAFHTDSTEPVGFLGQGFPANLRSAQIVEMLDDNGSVCYGLRTTDAEGNSRDYGTWIRYAPELWIADLDGDGVPELLLCGDMASDDYMTWCWRWQDGGLVNVLFGAGDGEEGRDRTDGRIAGIYGDTVLLEAWRYVLGTYTAQRRYGLDESGFLSPLPESLWCYTEEHRLTTVRELPVTLEGRRTSLPAETNLQLTGTNGDTEAYFTLQDGRGGVITRERGPEEWPWYIDGVEETEYFTFLPYAG